MSSIQLNVLLYIGSNNSGYYELQAVLTHKGRSSNSGHYVAWTKYKGDTWIECNDDDVNPIHVEDVLKLSGGGKEFLRLSSTFNTGLRDSHWP